MESLRNRVRQRDARELQVGATLGEHGAYLLMAVNLAFEVILILDGSERGGQYGWRYDEGVAESGSAEAGE